MRKLLLTTALLVAATGCTSNSTKYEASVDAASQARQQTVTTAISSIPDWYLQQPASTDKVVYVTGTGKSAGLSMAKNKALLDAQRQLADQVNSVVRGSAEQYSKEAGVNSAALYEETTVITEKLIKDANVSGYTVVQSEIQKEGSAYRMYVLMAYPLGENNTIRIMQLQDTAMRQAARGKAQASADLDAKIKAQQARDDYIATGKPNTVLLTDDAVDNVISNIQ